MAQALEKSGKQVEKKREASILGRFSILEARAKYPTGILR
jgi:hypothetical protein